MAKKTRRVSLRGQSVSAPKTGRAAQVQIKISEKDLGNVLKCLAKTGRMTLKIREISRGKKRPSRLATVIED